MLVIRQHPKTFLKCSGEDIVYAPGNRGINSYLSASVCVKSATVCGLRSKHDERTEEN